MVERIISIADDNYTWDRTKGRGWKGTYLVQKVRWWKGWGKESFHVLTSGMGVQHSVWHVSERYVADSWHTGENWNDTPTKSSFILFSSHSCKTTDHKLINCIFPFSRKSESNNWLSYSKFWWSCNRIVGQIVLFSRYSKREHLFIY
jgi:hypothetical protein